MKMTHSRNQKLISKGLNESYESDVKKFNNWLGSRPIGQDSIEEYFKFLESHCKVRTVARKKSALKAALKGMFGSKLTLNQQAQLDSVFKNIKVGQPDLVIHEHKVLTKGELVSLIEEAGEKTGAMVAALYDSGTRVSELLSIELNDCEIRGETVFCKVRRGKNKKERIVYLQKNTFDKLNLLYRGKKYLIEHKGKQLSRFTVSTLLKRAGKQIKRPDLHPHTLRHSKATHLIHEEMTVSAVAQYLGHSSPATTAKFYIHQKPTANKVLAWSPMQDSKKSE